MSTVARGNKAELYVAHWFEDRGWLVGSRRHIGGAGDLLAIYPDSGVTWLVEVKKRKNLYSGFTRAKRQEMIETPLPPKGERWVVNVISEVNEHLLWVPEKAWPK